MNARRSPVLAVVVALATWLFAATALAAPGGAGRIVVSLPGGSLGPLVLTPGQGGWVGEFTVTNVGAEPLTVSRVALRGDDDDVRSPARLSVRFVDGAATSAVLAPGASKGIVVSWMPDRDPRMRQAYGHVVVTSTDEQAGEVAMGFRAQIPTGVGWVGEHALSLLVLWPLVLLPASGVWWWTGRRERLLRRVAIAVAVVELLLALWAYRHFVPGVGRADGNDGFQLVERFVWVRSLGCEWYLGVDGFSLSLVVLTAVAALVALLVTDAERRSEGYYAAIGLLTSGILGSLVALDLLVLFGAWQAALLGLILLAGGWGGRRGPHAAAKLVAYGAVGSGAMLLAFVALSRASGRAFLVDGFSVAHTTSIPELARTSFASKAPILGVPFVEVAWGLLFVAVAFATPIVPLHAWLPEVLEEAPAGAGIVAGAAFVALGPYLLVRVGLGAMPEGARWAGSSLAAIGALGALWGALCSMAQRDLRRFVAYATVTAGGACLYGIGALTAQGIAGGAAILFAHGLATTLLLGVAASLSQRMRTVDAQRIGGLIGEAPGLAVITGVALGVSMGAPGLAGSWGLLLAVVGGFVRHPVLAAILVVALAASTAAHLRIARHVLVGQVDPAWRKSALLAPFGGRLPDAVGVELVALAPLVLLSLLLGLWPAALLSPMAVAARDTSAVLDPDGPDPTIDHR